MNKRCLSFVLALVMILTMVPMTAVAASADRFTDVTKDKWYYTFVDYVAEKGYFSGTSETKFSPDVTMTRAMFVTALANMESVTADNSKTAFTDVPAGKWYTGAAKWAVDNKILSGYSDGTFRPNAKITREEMCVIMSNYIAYHSEKNNVEHKKEGSTKAFSDASQISSWAKTAVADCRAYGLIDGFSDGTFRPKKESTRAEVAAVIYKLAWLVKEEPTTGGGSSSGSGSRTPIETRTLRLVVEGDLIAALNNVGPNTVAESKDYSMDDKAYDVMKAMLDQACDLGYIDRAYSRALSFAETKGVLVGNEIKGIPYTVPSGQMTNAIVNNTQVMDAIVRSANTALTTAHLPVLSEADAQDLVQDIISGNPIPADAQNKAVLKAIQSALESEETTFVRKVQEMIPAGYETVLTRDAIIAAKDEYKDKIDEILARPDFQGISLLAEGANNATLGGMTVYLDVYEAMEKQYNASKSRLESMAVDGSLGTATSALVEMAHPDQFIDVSGTTQTLKITNGEGYHTYLTEVMRKTKAALDENRGNEEGIEALADFIKTNFPFMSNNNVTVTIDGTTLTAAQAETRTTTILTALSNNTDLTMKEWLQTLGYTVSDYRHVTSGTTGTVVLTSNMGSLDNVDLPNRYEGGQMADAIQRYFDTYKAKLNFTATLSWDIER